jgi:hypothetical protein
MDGSLQEKHAFQELDSLKAADHSSQTALALSRALVSTTGASCGALGFDHGSPRVSIASASQPQDAFGAGVGSQVRHRAEEYLKVFPVETFLKHCVHRILELNSDTCPLWDLEEIYKSV